MQEQRQRGSVDDSTRRVNAELVLSHLDGLPTLSAVAVRLLQITSDPESAAGTVIDVLRGDQSLTAKVLSVARSAAMGVRVPVTTLDKAVPLLGFSALRSIVLAVSVFECFPATAPAAGNGAFERAEFWKHALAAACAARRLATDVKSLRIDPQDAFVAGLLHDLGKVALSAVFPKAYDRIAASANEARGDIADFERAILGVDHTVAGRRLAERWRLPRNLCEAIWLHHLAADSLPSSVVSATLIGLVQAADTIAREQRIGYSGNHTFYEDSSRLAERLHVTPEQLSALSCGLVGDVAQHAELLGLNREPPDALYLQAMTRANTELGRLNTELSLSNQQLAAAARYFRALGEFDQQLDASSDPAAVVAAMAHAATSALQRPKAAAFGVHVERAAIDLCWVDDAASRTGAVSQNASADLVAWLHEPGECLEVVLTRTPAVVQAALEAVVEAWDRGPCWLLPIVHDRRVIGGIVYWSEGDEHVRLSRETDELRSFVASLALALERANAQAAARRLSDELAEANRRSQQMQAELLRSRTLSMIAEMAAGAGHELNSPLTVISGRAQMLAQTLSAPDAQRALELIQAKAHECSKIVSELMDFARPRAPALERVELAELLRAVRDEWIARPGHYPELVRLEPPVPGAGESCGEIQADREQLLAVLRELLANAEDAFSDQRGTIFLGWRPASTENLVEVLVRDTGCGMPPNVLQHAFDPFFSKRRAGRGRGLGLARAYRIVEGHGGRIWLESVPGEGTTVHVLLRRGPAAQSPSA